MEDPRNTQYLLVERHRLEQLMTMANNMMKQQWRSAAERTELDSILFALIVEHQNIMKILCERGVIQVSKYDGMYTSRTHAGRFSGPPNSYKSLY